MKTNEKMCIPESTMLKVIRKEIYSRQKKRTKRIVDGDGEMENV